jgi:hypothetical protein
MKAYFVTSQVTYKKQISGTTQVNQREILAKKAVKTKITLKRRV